MTTNRTFFPFLETDLASRHSAARVRSEIECALQSGGATLDLSKVLSISESYADELFGVLVRDLGLERVLAGLHLQGASPNVLHSIVSAIRLRLSGGITAEKTDTTLALLTARKELAKRNNSHREG
jgi:hypothetical protein